MENKSKAGYQKQLVKKWLLNMNLLKKVERCNQKNYSRVRDDLMACDGLIFKTKDTLLSQNSEVLSENLRKLIESSLGMIISKQNKAILNVN